LTIGVLLLTGGIGLALGVGAAAMILGLRRAGQAQREREILGAAERASALIEQRTERRARARSAAGAARVSETRREG